MHCVTIVLAPPSMHAMGAGSMLVILCVKTPSVQGNDRCDFILLGHPQCDTPLLNHTSSLVTLETSPFSSFVFQNMGFVSLKP